MSEKRQLRTDYINQAGQVYKITAWKVGIDESIVEVNDVRVEVDYHPMHHLGAEWKELIRLSINKYNSISDIHPCGWRRWARYYYRRAQAIIINFIVCLGGYLLKRYPFLRRF